MLSGLTRNHNSNLGRACIVEKRPRTIKMPFAVVGRVGPKKMAAQIHPAVSPQLEETLGKLGWRSAAYGHNTQYTLVTNGPTVAHTLHCATPFSTKFPLIVGLLRGRYGQPSS